MIIDNFLAMLKDCSLIRDCCRSKCSLTWDNQSFVINDELFSWIRRNNYRPDPWFCMLKNTKEWTLPPPSSLWSAVIFLIFLLCMQLPLIVELCDRLWDKHSGRCLLVLPTVFRFSNTQGEGRTEFSWSGEVAYRKDNMWPSWGLQNVVKGGL